MDWWGWVFPRRCVGCGRWGRYVCGNCEVGMWEEEQICPVCRRASRYGVRHKYCKGPMEGLICWWAYDGLVRKLILRAKYKYNYDLLGELIINNEELTMRADLGFLEKFLGENPVVVPVPLFAKRERGRGFNQSKIISLSLSKNLGLEEGDMLVRVRDTGQQVGRTREERLQNIANAFALNPNSKFQLPKHVLLVDDVWTTGATMNECARMLRQAGVKRVWGLVLAR